MGGYITLVMITINEMEVYMCLSNIFKKKRSDWKDMFSSGQTTKQKVNYEQTINYLTGLSRTDFDKIVKVAGIYRVANKEAAKIIGIKEEPTASIQEDIVEANVDATLESVQMDFIETPIVNHLPDEK